MGGHSPVLIDKIDKMRHALELARDKLEVYRDHYGGEYLGGLEYSRLRKLIDEALE